MIRFWRPTRKTKLKVAVVGNCQARPIAQLLTSASSETDVIATAVVHLLKNEEKDHYEGQFRKADLILAQRVVDSYPCTFVRTSELKLKWGAKVITWPNVFYRGYNPELLYVRLGNHQPLRGPLGDYHIQTFLDSWKKGLTVQEALQRYSDINYNQTLYNQVPTDSLIELKEREQACDIKIADYIEKLVWIRRLFFTFNHPKIELLSQIIKTFLKLKKISVDESKITMNYEPLGQIEPPINPWISAKFNPDKNDSEIWKGLKIKSIDHDVISTGKKCDYRGEDIIHIYYQIYNENKGMIIDFLKN